MELVRMLTIEGARALGVDGELGSIEPGKRADLVVLDLSDPKFAPETNVPALVANTATAGDVESTIVDAKVLMHDNEVRSMNSDAIRERVKTPSSALVTKSAGSWGVAVAFHRVTCVLSMTSQNGDQHTSWPVLVCNTSEIYCESFLVETLNQLFNLHTD